MYREKQKYELAEKKFFDLYISCRALTIWLFVSPVCFNLLKHLVTIWRIFKWLTMIIMICSLDKLSSSLIVSAISPRLMMLFSWWENIFYFWFFTNFVYWFLSKRLRCLIELQLRGALGVVARCVPVLLSAFEELINQFHAIQKRENHKMITQ